ncbi:MAG: hypothetical protein JNK58_01705 [Phycisphaerae bacterium]|nr:hypothetical protein [Phycisphaerae bacterium]
MKRAPACFTLGVGALTLVLASSSVLAGPRSEDGMWEIADEVPMSQLRAVPWVRPNYFVGVNFDAEVFEAVLADAPMEFTDRAWEAPVIMQLPMPDGTFQTFEVWESPVMHPDLAAQVPGVKTWAGQGIDDPTATLRMDITPMGFHSQVLSAGGSFYIDPFTKGDTTFYAVYERNDLRERGLDGWNCLGAERPSGLPMLQRRGATGVDRTTSGTFLQTYRTAVAATGEYTAFFGGTAAAGQAGIVTAINRVTGVYEREIAVRLTLVANNINIVYTNAATDPYTNSNGVTMLTENQNNITAVIGSANYDIGHVFSTGGGGVASLGVVCVNSSKARGVTGLTSPQGDAFYIDYVAHEMGHQFGANHSFNGLNGSCAGGNRSAGSAYEPGSGSTIMAYAGICGVDDLQSNSNDYFIHKSIDDIVAFTTGATGGCPANVANGNTIPTVNAGPDYTIPANTPFMLVGTGGDADGDSITYCWEERDLGPAQGASGGIFVDNGSSPFIRSFLPTTDPVRIIPRVPNLLANTFIKGERLPVTNRNVNFRLTVRDNRAGGGGIATDDMVVTSTTSAGPFAVTAPNGGGTLSGSTTVTWNVTNTNIAPVNCANVMIELSTDGGNTWPTVLLASTPNDGSEMVTLPAITTSSARVRVRAVGNIFFDISNSNFSITPPAGAPGAFSLTSPANGATGVSLTPTLTWGSASSATSYEVTIDTDPSFTPPFVYQNNTASTSQLVPGATLSNSTLYYWRVIASNGSGSTNGSPNPASFTTAPPPAPGAFSLTSPANGATNQSVTPTLVWTAAPGASSYQVTIDTDAGFARPNTFQTVTGFTSVVVPAATLSEGTQYFWRVVASNAGGSTNGSPNPSTFTTVPPPCVGDADGDGDRDFSDITSVLANFGAVYLPSLIGAGDADHNGVVDFSDITSVLANFGSPC